MQSKIRALISGRVQGVFFRWSTFEEATRLALVGFVRNMKDGRVEVVAQGEKANIEKLLGYLRVGPPMAEVHNIEVEWGDHEEELEGFIVAKTV